MSLTELVSQGLLLSQIQSSGQVCVASTRALPQPCLEHRPPLLTDTDSGAIVVYLVQSALLHPQLQPHTIPVCELQLVQFLQSWALSRRCTQHSGKEITT